MGLFFVNKEILNVRLLLTFPGAAWKGSFFLNGFFGYQQLSRHSQIMFLFVSTLTRAPAVPGAVQTQSNGWSLS